MSLSHDAQQWRNTSPLERLDEIVQVSNLGCLLCFQFKTSQIYLQTFIICNKHMNQHFIQPFYLTITLFALHEHMAAVAHEND